MESETETGIFDSEIITSHLDNKENNLQKNQESIVDGSTQTSVNLEKSLLTSLNSNSSSQKSISESNNETVSEITCSTIRVLPATSARTSLSGKGSRGGYRVLPCTFPGCSRVFNRPAKLLEHVRTHTKERPFHCTFSGCNKDYSREDHLNRHMATHSIILNKQVSSDTSASKSNNLPQTENVGYYCTYQGCEKYYLYSHHLKRHERIHKDKSLLQCSWEGCDFKTNKRSKLHTHTCKHQGVLPYVCSHPDCSKAFPTPNKLAEHALTHIAKDKYLCGHPDCLARFSFWKDLNNHFLTCHPYICTLCEKTFSSSTKLLSHRRTHGSDDLTSEQPDIIRVRCLYPDCTSSFREKKNLMSHIQTIHEQRDAQICSVEGCGKKFLSKGRLQVHVYKVHSKKDDQSSESKTQKLRKAKVVSSQKTSIKELIASRVKTLPDKGTLPCPSPGCVARYHLVSMLERHLVKDHEIDLNSYVIDDEKAQTFALKYLDSRTNLEHMPTGSSKALNLTISGSDPNIDMDSTEELDYIESD